VVCELLEVEDFGCSGAKAADRPEAVLGLAEGGGAAADLLGAERDHRFWLLPPLTENATLCAWAPAIVKR